MRRQRHVVRLAQRRDLPHLTNAAGLPHVGLQNVDAAVLQIGNDFPDGAVAFTSAMGMRICCLSRLNTSMLPGQAGSSSHRMLYGSTADAN